MYPRNRTVLGGLAVLLALLGTQTLALARGDHDGDGDVDLSDYAALAGCMAGPEGGLASNCAVFDFDDDGDVDLRDYSLFHAYLGLSAPPGMALVPGGVFQMGDSFDEGYDEELPVHPVYVSPFAIDRFEVTNQAYVDGLNWAYSQGGLITVIDGVVYKYNSETDYPYCVTRAAPTGYPQFSEHSRTTWNGSTFGVVSGKGDHPMVMVTWYGSVAYCNWRSTRDGRSPCYDLSTWTCDFGADGFRLPTEAEWEKAAAWDPVGRRHFRFSEHTDGCSGSCLDGQRANYWSNDDPYEAGPATYPNTTPVGFFNGELHQRADFGWPLSDVASYQTQEAKSYYGCYDMCGNVAEWCYDWHMPGFYTYPEATVPDPIGPVWSTYRVYRGSSWYYVPYMCRSAKRWSYTPDKHGWGNVGIRCVVGLP